MKKIISAITLVLVALGSAYADDKVIATYNDKQVTESELNSFLKEVSNQQGGVAKKFSEFEKNDQINIANTYVMGLLVEEEAKKQKIDQSAEFQKKMELIKSNLLGQEALNRYLKDKYNDKMLDAEYKELTKQFKDKAEIKASHILVENVKLANEIYEKIQKGEKFENLVKTHSIDTQTKNQGGSLDYFMQGQMLPAFDKKAFSMKVGEISKPVQTDFGWHIIKLEDKRKVKIPTKEEARSVLMNQIQAKLTREYTNNLAKQAKVDIKIK